MTKVILKDDWDKSISNPCDDESGMFIGREVEVESLKNYFKRRDSSSVLISGHRGSGKSSFIKKVIHELKKNVNDEQTIKCVYLNAPLAFRKNGVEEKSFDRRHFYRTLVSRLYHEMIEEVSNKSDIGKGIRDLYHKTIAQKYYKENESNIGEQNKAHTEILSSYSLDVVKIIQLMMVILLSFIAYSFVDAIHIIPEEFRRIVASVSAFGTLFTHKIIVNKKKVESHISEKNEKQYYLYDNDISTIEYELEIIHRKMKIENIKLLYIFDELDKVDSTAFSLTLNEMKNFISSGYTHFVFLTDEKSSEKFNQDNDLQRGESYTYFTNKVYISRPSISDLKKYLGSIVCESSDGEKYHLLVDALIFRSKADYFDLIQEILGHVNSYENGPTINIFADYEEKVRYMSNISNCVFLIFEKKYKSLNQKHWRRNEEILRNLFDFAHKIFFYRSSIPIKDYVDGESEMSYLAKKDVGEQLVRLGCIKKKADVPISNVEFTSQYTSYISLGDFNFTPPGELGFLSSFESSFVEDVKNFIVTLNYFSSILNCFITDNYYSYLDMENMNNIVSSYSKIADRFRADFAWSIKNCEKSFNIFQNFHKEPPVVTDIDTLESNNSIIDAETASMENRIVSSVCKIWCKSLNSRMHHDITLESYSRTQLHMYDYLKDFDIELASRISNKKNHVIWKKSSRKAIFVLHSNDDITKGIPSLLNKDRSDAATKYSILYLSNTAKKPSLEDRVFYVNLNKSSFEKDLKTQLRLLEDWLAVK
ncbi:ATP-binding protein [Halobacteriovorax sp. ZH5_bin.2]|uniref:ATP-binding protein n=1 Tax=Halobacteriovorax sp. ZH5_bin.2 TaxID=3157727 RepID=UPI00371092BB